MDNVDALRAELLAEVEQAGDLEALEQVRIGTLGKKGRITDRMKTLGGLDPEARKAAGQALNAVKDAVTEAIEARRTALAGAALDARLARERIDVSLPARPEARGRIHPITQTIDELTAIFCQMGFTVAEGPDIESDYYNFTALNIPEDHPARQEHDTFYLQPDAEGRRKVLRTHTSPVQIRAMEKSPPPIRIIVPGRTFRSDHDATHSPMFHQVEGLVVDKKAHMGHLKGCLIGCTREGGEFRIGHGGDWLEILGSGMVNPRVLANAGIDPTEYQGFAFGMGIERIAMLKYGIPDLRPFYDSDLRWLRHYGFVPIAQPTIAGGL